MSQIKDAFSKVKEDIISLKEETSFLRKSLIETMEKLIELCELINNLNNKILPKEIPTIPTQNQTTPTHIPTHPQEIGGLKTEKLDISTGNEGVPTDRQTDRQTDQHKENFLKDPIETPKNAIKDATDLLSSLDTLKKEIRLKFKRLTEQEFLVFSTIYQLEEMKEEVDYKILSIKLKLTESSIRDYVGKLISKGIPVDKKRINNKTINLSISPNLKKIAPLPTIFQLRGL